MKRLERHRLKENEVALSVQRVREEFEHYQSQIIAAVVAVVVILVALGGYTWWRQQRSAKSRAMLDEALAIDRAPVVPPAPPGSPATPTSPATPATATVPPPGSYPTERAKLEAELPKLLAAANGYPSTSAGIVARYRAASTMLALGRSKEAIDQFRQVADRAGNGIYGDMARLGMANAEAAAGQYDAAINTYKELSVRKDGRLPIDGVLMQLGRTYQMAGKTNDAAQTFERLINEFPESPYAAAARQEQATIKGTGAGV